MTDAQSTAILTELAGIRSLLLISIALAGACLGVTFTAFVISLFRRRPHG